MRHALAAALILAQAGAAAANPAHGLWRTESNEAGGHLVVELLPCETDPALTCGVIREAVGPSGPNADYPHLGREIIDGMEPDGAAFSGGTIWAPDDDETYRSEMELKGDVLAVEGCVLVFCRGQDWRRVERP
jgi:uncharacterized protein (DUF2147 family)